MSASLYFNKSLQVEKAPDILTPYYLHTFESDINLYTLAHRVPPCIGNVLHFSLYLYMYF